ncbi:uncharacterized protein LOC128674410 [Plodia interpunctella]|uniref:uncharacterized protein LOC128674410 n=1 Tax=Plodia interpunctella TaxID=58824 RepID=UPI002368D1B0|nr:uncharacterized protein LOC128674410 [Plodia interpunctella]XP_053608887.1 uncharacterized protein LOC128674410 [Plodia interpunctella]
MALRRAVLQIIKKHGVASSVAVRHRSTNTERNILKSIYSDIPMTNETLCDYLWENLDRWPDKTATVCGLTGRGYTFAQTHRMSVSFAASLRSKLKLKDGDTVAVILPNVPEYPCVVVGILQAGCVVSPMNPLYTTEELKHQLKLIDCKAVVTSKLTHANVVESLKENNMNIPVILIDNEGLPEGTIKFAEFAEDLTVDIDCLKSVKRTADDVACIPFSSGTSGFPKGVELTHKSLVAANKSIALPEIVVVLETTATQQSAFTAVIPFFHIFGFCIQMINQLALGCKLVTLPYFKPDIYVKTIATYKTDALFIVPPIAVFLGKHPMVTSEHLSHVRAIIAGAAPLAKEDAEAVVSKNKNIIFRQGYGLTETCGSISVADNKDSNYASVGFVFSNSEVKIADVNTKKALGPGEEGEIWFRGPSLMKGYYKNEKATKEDITQDGWYKTGDIGKYDKKNYLYVTDRMKELIKVKGYQVAPAELETLIRLHPKIADCAVLGVPDQISGEVPKAFIVPFPGQEVKAEEVMEFVNGKVTSFKKIKHAQIVNEIPKTAAGKVLKRVLKEKYV